MKKWIAIAVVLLCLGVYAMVKLSVSQHQDANPHEKEMPGAKQTDADNTDEAGTEEDSGTPETAAQVEAVTKAFSEFQAAVESQDYEQAWKLMSKSFKSQGSFEEFKKGLPDARDEILKSTIRPESATSIGGRVRLLVVDPSGREEQISFIQEDGQWKFAP